MNFVLGSILLFILISPGLIFRFSYLQGTYARQSFKIAAVDEIFWAIIPALFIQLISIVVVEVCTDYSIRLDYFYQLITNARGEIIDFENIRESVPLFLGYYSIQIAVAIAAGVGARQLVRHFRLDHQFQFLRIRNEWYYLFSGEILDFNARGASSEIAMIQVDVLVNTSDGNVIYSGTLIDYYLSSTNGLDRICLTSVYRRKFKEDLGLNEPNVGYLERHLDERYYTMPGDLFVINFDKIINLNITYYADEGGLMYESNE